MHVRSGTPYWRIKQGARIDASPLEGDVRCEALIIGGGITGALTAWFLVKEGVDTVLVDGGELGMGSTAASTGLLVYEVDTHLVELIRLIGEQPAVHAYRRGVAAVDQLEALCADLAVDCEFSRRATLYLASDQSDGERLRREAECRQAFAFDVRLLDRAEIASVSSLPQHAAIQSAGNAQVDPLRLTRALIDGAVAMGLRTYARTLIERIDRTGDSSRALAANGSIACRQVIFATGYESAKYVDRPAGELNTSYAFVTPPLGAHPGWPDGALIWETSRPYFYARQTADGRAMIGGCDTRGAFDHRHPELIERQVSELASQAQRYFPAIDIEPEYAWAGTFGESEDGLAYIGRPPGRSDFFAIGYGGNGITFGMIAASLIRDLYLGRPNADEAVFRFGRS